MPKVFLVNPANKSFGYSFITPRWLFTIASATPVDLGDPVIVDETIKKFDPRQVSPGDIVGIGITTGNCIPGYKALREAKLRGATVIVGGIHATIFPEEPLEMGADAVVTGNGDIVWGQAVNDALRGKLKKIYEGGKVPGDQLLEARWDLLDPSKYMLASVQTVAGCPENCNFCSVWVTDGRRPRQRLTEKIISEVNTLGKMGFRFIIFADDNFNPSTLGRIAREPSPAKRKEFERIREERLEFFEEYSQSVPEDIFAFTQMTSEVTSDPEYLKEMHDKARVRAALIGVESYSEEGLRSANKTWNPVGQKMVDTIQMIESRGICVLSSIICGLETDTVETLETMGQFAIASGSTMAQFTLYTPYPGTVDFLEMMRDMKLRNEAIENPLAQAPKHSIRIVHDSFWTDSRKPVVLIKHPKMDGKELIARIKNNWNLFYSFKEIFRRARSKRWPLLGKIWYIFGSLAFKSLYAGHGIAADSVKNKEMALSTKLLLKIAIGLFNQFFRKKNRAVLPV